MVQNPRITFRVPPEDKDRYHAMAEERGLPLSKWVRGLMDGKRSPAPGELQRLEEILAELQEVRFQVAQVGKNLNQLTKGVHSKRIHTLEGQDDLLRQVSRSFDQTRAAVDRCEQELHRRFDQMPEPEGEED